jgi:hypothetical protein
MHLQQRGSDWMAEPKSQYKVRLRCMLALARALGSAVPPNRPIEIRDIHALPQGAGTIEGKALAAQRFDRAPGRGRSPRPSWVSSLLIVSPEFVIGRSTTELSEQQRIVNLKLGRGCAGTGKFLLQ